MRNRLLIILTALSISVMLAPSCDFRPLYVEGETPVDVLVITDWTQLGAAPSGSTICFYPTDGTEPWVFKTNSVAKTMVKVPSGHYTVMVFNRAVDEFGSMKFNGMDSLGTAMAILEDKLFSWVGRSDTAGRTVYEPEEIVVGRTDDFLVRTIGELDSVEVVTERMVYSGNISVKIQGIHNIKSMRAYITGLAGTGYLATRTAGNSPATHVLESWKAEREDTDYTEGHVRTDFRCLGLPVQYLENPKDENNKLVLQFKLVDGKTELTYVIHVGKNIRQIEKERAVYVVVDADDNGNPIVIPDVKPAGGSESGFDVHFEDWDDPIDVPIGT